MTAEQRRLLEAICADPWDDAPRLAYAAWLEQQAPSDPRAEAIRLAVKTHAKRLNTLPELDDRLQLLADQDRLQELLGQHQARWHEPVLELAEQCSSQRGFVASATLSARAFVEHAAELFARAPLVHIILNDVAGHLAAFCASPYVGRIRSLSLTRQGLGDPQLRTLAAAEGFEQLWYLDLADNQISVDGVIALAASEHFPQLRHVVLDNNPGDVHERCHVELAVVDAWLPPAGKKLEEQIGPVPWLHFPEACWQVWPVDPCGKPV